MKTVKNFARFYALLNGIPGDKEETKKMLVESFTNGRTDSLRGMTPAEYNAMCNSMDGQEKKPVHSITANLKGQRSAVLHRLQKLGVNTADWSEVDRFCLNSRIAGKKFYNLTAEELSNLVPKLEAIARKPIRREPEPVELVMDSHLLNLIIQSGNKHLLN